MVELKALCKQENMDVIGISETWECQEINDAERYNLFRRDHKAGHSGVTFVRKKRVIRNGI